MILLPTVALAQAPTLPQAWVDTAYTPAACTVTVNSGGNVQTAINNASLGDTICLEAGATFTGNFTLPNKGAGTSYIVITTTGTLPAQGTRVAPADATQMAKLTAGSGNILAVANGAHHYRFVGIEITPSAYLNALAEFQSPGGTASDTPSFIIFDRCYLHGHVTLGTRRGIGFQVASGAVIDSYLSQFMEVGGDAQAIAAWNGPGPFKIVNNYLEGAAENVLFGGADPSITDLIPSDITFQRNYVFKPLTWKVGDPSYAGTHWAVKNSFELKSSLRVLVENNLFENNWVDGQTGIAILFTVRNQSGGCEWCEVSDVTFRNNHIKNVDGGLNILSTDYTFPSEISQRISVTNNLWTITDNTNTSIQFLSNTPGGITGLVFSHNTLDTVAPRLIYFAGTTSNPTCAMSYNIGQQNTYGVFAEGGGLGTAALNGYCDSYTFEENVLIGPNEQASYPAGQYWPANTAAVGFENYAGGDYRLDSASAYYGIAPNGADIGAYIPSVGIQTITLSAEVTGSAAQILFSKVGLGSTSCDVRYGDQTTVSASGGDNRTVNISGLVNGQSYFVGVDCGVEGGMALAEDIVGEGSGVGQLNGPVKFIGAVKKQ